MRIRIKKSGHEQIISKDTYNKLSDYQKMGVEIIDTKKPSIVADIEKEVSNGTGKEEDLPIEVKEEVFGMTTGEVDKEIKKIKKKKNNKNK